MKRFLAYALSAALLVTPAQALVFNVWFNKVPTLKQIDQSVGTRIGNMTSNGGLAAIFDGVTNQASTSGGSAAGGDGYAGKAYSTARLIGKAIVYGSNNNGYVESTNPSITLTLYGKNGTPGSATDGTTLASVSFTDTADEHVGRTLTVSNPSQRFTNAWVAIAGGGGSTTHMAELQLFDYE